MTSGSRVAGDAPAIDRGFVRVDGTLVHYRAAEPHESSPRLPPYPPPLYAAHSGPGSSASLAPLVAEWGRTRRVIAPDMPGNGDSEPLPIGDPDIRNYVDVAIGTMDAMGLEKVDFYGQHSGAHIGCELAIRHPDRVRRLVLDGIALFSDADRDEFAGRYAPPVAPDEHGGHLAWAWYFVDGLTMHFPYYRRDAAHRLHASTVPPAAVRHALVVDLLKALPTYHLAYRAAFAHRAAERLPLLRVPTLVTAVEGDPLSAYRGAAAALVSGAVGATVPRADRAETVRAFLDG